MDTPAIVVHRLGAERRDDYLRFFDHERGAAFCDNPEWAKCYCHFYHVPKAIDWKAFDASANRVAITARIDASEMDGFLAYAGNEVVGWINAQPMTKLPHAHARLGVAMPPPRVPPHEAAAIVCFVVAPAWRRRRVATMLLHGALDSFAARGISVVDAFPFKAASTARDSDHYHGPESLFRAAGFAAIGENDDVTLMRKHLPPRQNPVTG